MSRAEDERTAGAAARRRADPSPRPVTPSSPDPLTGKAWVRDAIHRDAMVADGRVSVDLNVWNNLVLVADLYSALPSAPDHRLREAAQAWSDAKDAAEDHDERAANEYRQTGYRLDEEEEFAAKTQRLFNALVASEETLRAVLSEATPGSEPGLDVEGRSEIARLDSALLSAHAETLRVRAALNEALTMVHPGANPTPKEWDDFITARRRLLALSASQTQEPDIQ